MHFTVSDPCYQMATPLGPL